jgi:hypothetical protein
MAIVKCILYRKSTEEIINFNYMVNDEYMPPSGLDPDLAVYPYYYPYPEPVFDARLFVLQINQNIVEQAHPVYPQVNRYEVTYEEVKRDPEEMKIEVQNAMTAANQSIYNGYNMNEVVIKTAYVLDKKIASQQLAVWETEILSLNKEIAAKIQNNLDICKQKIADIDLGKPVNIDEGWITE